jgi:ferredoxin
MKGKEDDTFPAISRRTFLRRTGIVGLLVFFPLPDSGDKILRPPGAGKDFLSRCIRCGKCAEACPFDSIQFLDISKGLLVHTPYIDPLKTPCYLCRERSDEGENLRLGKYLRCGEACPTGALRLIENNSEALSKIPDDLKIGVAKLDNQLCVAWQFGFCGECYFNCPMQDKAMMRKPPDKSVAGEGIFPHIDEKYCIGCGVCTFLCPVRENLIDLDGGDGPGYFEQRYGGFVRKLLNKNRNIKKLPAVTVEKRSEI